MIDSLTVGGVDMLHGPWDMERVTGWFDTPGVRLETVDRLRHGEHTSDGRTGSFGSLAYFTMMTA